MQATIIFYSICMFSFSRCIQENSGRIFDETDVHIHQLILLNENLNSHWKRNWLLFFVCVRYVIGHTEWQNIFGKSSRVFLIWCEKNKKTTIERVIYIFLNVTDNIWNCCHQLYYGWFFIFVWSGGCFPLWKLSKNQLACWRSKSKNCLRNPRLFTRRVNSISCFETQ